MCAPMFRAIKLIGENKQLIAGKAASKSAQEDIAKRINRSGVAYGAASPMARGGRGASPRRSMINM